MRTGLMLFVLFVSAFSFSAHGAIYVQVEANQLDVQTDLAGASIKGMGFGGRAGYRWRSLGFEAGYTTATGKLDGQIFSPSDKYETSMSMMTAGIRWWLGRYFDVSGGLVSTNGNTDMSVTIPLLGSFAGKGDYSSSGSYFGVALNIPINKIDLFLAYNMYRWAEAKFNGSLTGLSSDTGVNTISGGVRVTF